MTYEEFKMTLMLGDWVETPHDKEEISILYTNRATPFSIGIHAQIETNVVIYQNGTRLGVLGYEEGLNTVNHHMMMMQIAEKTNGS